MASKTGKVPKHSFIPSRTVPNLSLRSVLKTIRIVNNQNHQKISLNSTSPIISKKNTKNKLIGTYLHYVDSMKRFKI